MSIVDSLANLAISMGRSNHNRSSQVVNIIEFIEASWGLNMKLFPVQRVILKAHYGLALDETNRYLEITDFRRQNAKFMTEADYLRMLFDEGRCNAREVVQGQERREMVLSIGRRSGKCVRGDTRVLTDKGLVSIESLGDPQGAKVQPLEITVSQEGVEKTSKSAYFYNGGVRDTLEITTKAGFSLCGTPNHRIRVLSKDTGAIVWKQLDEVNSGDYVGIHRRTNLWPTEYLDVSHLKGDYEAAPLLLDENWGLLLGYLTGDGSWTAKKSLEITADHSETQAEIQNLHMKMFGKSSYRRDLRTAQTLYLSVYSKKLREFAGRLGFSRNVVSITKMVPWAILQSPRSVVVSYLQGLFESDGSFSAKGEISLTSASQAMLRDVQLLLLNLGIVARLGVHSRAANITYYRLRIAGKSDQRVFLDEIGFRSQKKQSALVAALAGYTKDDIMSVPHQDIKFRQAIKPLPTLVKSEYKRNYKSSSPLTYTKMRKLVADKIDYGAAVHFNKLLAADYFFDPIVSITQGRHKVYDLNVPEGASFVANGITNHNTTISSCIAAYETYKLISKGDPQEYYGLPASNNIQIISVATDKDQAGLLYQEVSGHFRSCPFFKQYTANNTMSYARFQTPKDIERYGSYAMDPNAKATLKVTFRSCVAKGLRGAGNIVVILDEVAHFTDAGQSSASAVYDAVTPSTTAFSPKDPNDKTIPTGPVEGRIISISSPLGRQGHFYKVFQLGMKGGRAASNMLCVQAPTWEVNPTVPAEEFEKHYYKDPAVFFTEYGGEFSDRTRGWIESAADLAACIDVDAKPIMKAPSRRPHFMGVDIALVGDACAAAIGHIEQTGAIRLDLVETIQAGVGKFKDAERLDFDDVASWIADLAKRFYISEGMFDQWAGIPMEQALQKKGLSQLKSVVLTKQLTSQMFQNFKDMMFDKKIVLYNYPIPTGADYCDYIQELLELQAEYHSKYVTTVEAPNIDGKHDDMSDALVRMVWLASKNLAKPSYIALAGGANAGAGFRNRGSVDPILRARRRALLGGSDPKRQKPTRGRSR